ncbi:MAG TPA: hypothetical protein VL381_00035 [Rhodocyclaceae bacterium]|jgi:hypothetical protein|nr:hypothetical protein [Rhodocyclaceae bacterium]
MKQAKQRARVQIKPRNPLGTSAVLKKGGLHQRKDKRASRAHQKAQLRRQAD